MAGAGGFQGDVGPTSLGDDAPRPVARILEVGGTGLQVPPQHIQLTWPDTTHSTAPWEGIRPLALAKKM